MLEFHSPRSLSLSLSFVLVHFSLSLSLSLENFDIGLLEPCKEVRNLWPTKNVPGLLSGVFRYKRFPCINLQRIGPFVALGCCFRLLLSLLCCCFVLLVYFVSPKKIVVVFLRHPSSRQCKAQERVQPALFRVCAFTLLNRRAFPIDAPPRESSATRGLPLSHRLKCTAP